GNVPKVRTRLPNGSEVQCVFDTGASYNIVIPRIAREYNLSAEDDAIIVLPQLDILGCNPPLSLRNVRVKVDQDFTYTGDQIILGSPVFDHFATVVLDLGTNQDQGIIR